MSFFLKKYLYKPAFGLSFLLISSIIFSFLFTKTIPNFIFTDMNLYILFIVGILIFCIILEVVFFTLYYLKNKRLYAYPPKVKFDKIPYKGHPYIPYVLKENKESSPPTISEYPLHKGKYKFGLLKSNNLGFMNGVNGDREVKIPKPKDIIRVNCLGSSTTQNYLTFNNAIYSYPLELEKILLKKFNNKIEVNNCGQGGYNSADILVRFLLQILDTEPDYVILYQGYADVRSYLSENFKSDYSHSRTNLLELYPKLKFSTSIPKMPFSFMNFLINHWFPYNVRQSLVEIIHTQPINLKLDPSKGLDVFERNLQYIIDICKTRNIKLILSTYCNFLYDDVKNKEPFKTYKKITDKENEKIVMLSKKNNLTIVDNANLIPMNEKYFVDTIHFSHEGMIKLAQNFADVVIKAHENK